MKVVAFIGEPASGNPTAPFVAGILGAATLIAAHDAVASGHTIGMIVLEGRSDA